MKKATRGAIKMPVMKEEAKREAPHVTAPRALEGLGSKARVKKAHDKRYVEALRVIRKGGDLEKVHSLLLSAAEDNDAFSIYALGTWYLHGFYFRKNVARAVKMLRFSADANVASSAFDLAVCYELGTGVKKNMNQAIRYYLRSFILGDNAGAVELERVLYWESVQIPCRLLSVEFGRYLSSINL